MITADLSAGLRVRACDCNSFRNQMFFLFLSVSAKTQRYGLPTRVYGCTDTHKHTQDNIMYSHGQARSQAADQ